MIKYEYTTDNGKVEACFDTFEELENFQESLRKRDIERQKEDERREEEERAAQEAARKERRDLAKRRYDELHDELKSVMLKAKNYDVSPDGVVKLITTVLAELAGDND